MAAKTLMILGTSSSVGKSLLVAGLCRLFARQGMRVAPFKAQNMSNNAAVCADGAEIGRAQAVQARAAGIEPCADMNPVLLKPEGLTRSQVVVLGKPWETLPAAKYYERKAALWSVVTGALERLRARFDLIVMEGAGSPVELNLKHGDIVNMAIAQYAQSPVLLVGDIDKGGIFAQLLGTLWLLTPEERSLVRGLIVNKFRGDRALFNDGLRLLEEKGQVPVLGVVPFVSDLGIPEEDAMALPCASPIKNGSEVHLNIAILRLPHVANFDDFDPLTREPGVRVRYVDSVANIGRPAALVVPGTKSTMADLAWLRERGLDKEIERLAQLDVPIVGICGGYQMLGRTLQDPEGIEGVVPVMPGLGLLPLETVFAREKITRRVTAKIVNGPAWLQGVRGQTVDGYEIHMGRTSQQCPWLETQESDNPRSVHADGEASADGKIWGCYLHGLFANTIFRQAWLASLSDQTIPDEAITAAVGADLEQSLDRWADVIGSAVDMHLIGEIIGLGS